MHSVLLSDHVEETYRDTVVIITDLGGVGRSDKAQKGAHHEKGAERTKIDVNAKSMSVSIEWEITRSLE